MSQNKNPLVSVTRNDCRWEYYRGSGKGGQNRNKVSTAVRCTHEPSGAVGQAEDSRSQFDNRVSAFKRMVQTNKFQRWLRVESARKMGHLIDIDDAVNKSLRPQNLLVEGKDKSGRWDKGAVQDAQD